MEGNPTYDSRENCNAIIKTANNSLLFGCRTTIIPNTVTTIEAYAFSGRQGLTKIIIPKSVISIDYASFADCSDLIQITIPISVTNIGGYAFNGSDNLTTINCFAESPPIMYNSNCFSSYDKATLYVPKESLERYQNENWWCLFKNIKSLTEVISGDVNGDGEVNIADINAVIGQILTANYTVDGDVNGDGEVNIADINAIIEKILVG